jgi:MFS family permease
MLSWGTGRVPVVLLAAVVVTTGLGAPASVIAFDLAREANPPERGGTATGVVNIGGFACAVFADLIIGWLLDALGRGGHEAAGYRSALAVLPALTGLGLVLFWRQGRRMRSSTGPRRSDVSVRPPVPGR